MQRDPLAPVGVAACRRRADCGSLPAGTMTPGYTSKGTRSPSHCTLNAGLERVAVLEVPGVVHVQRARFPGSRRSPRSCRSCNAAATREAARRRSLGVRTFSNQPVSRPAGSRPGRSQEPDLRVEVARRLPCSSRYVRRCAGLVLEAAAVGVLALVAPGVSVCAAKPIAVSVSSMPSLPSTPQARFQLSSPARSPVAVRLTKIAPTLDRFGDPCSTRAAREVVGGDVACRRPRSACSSADVHARACPAQTRAPP